MSKRRLQVVHSETNWSASQAIAELRQTGTIASAAFLVASAVLASVAWLDRARFTILAAMVLFSIAAVATTTTSWLLIMNSLRSVMPAESRERLDWARKKGSIGASAQVGLVSFFLGVGLVLLFLVLNIW